MSNYLSSLYNRAAPMMQQGMQQGRGMMQQGGNALSGLFNQGRNMMYQGGNALSGLFNQGRGMMQQGMQQGGNALSGLFNRASMGAQNAYNSLPSFGGRQGQQQGMGMPQQPMGIPFTQPPTAPQHAGQGAYQAAQTMMPRYGQAPAQAPAAAPQQSWWNGGLGHLAQQGAMSAAQAMQDKINGRLPTAYQSKDATFNNLAETGLGALSSQYLPPMADAWMGQPMARAIARPFDAGIQGMAQMMGVPQGFMGTPITKAASYGAGALANKFGYGSPMSPPQQPQQPMAAPSAGGWGLSRLWGGGQPQQPQGYDPYAMLGF